ncbi:hypothetical protein GGI09_005031 [Coemansia sp. S100]|nr:hypothetical protein GGI09_005031 [Coemansia sp. S100]
MNSDTEYAGGTLVEASDTYVGKMFGDDVAGVCAVAEDDTGLADEVVAGCVAVAVDFGKDADDVGDVDECAQDDDVEGVDECRQDDDDDKLVGNSLVGALAEYASDNCEVAKTEDGCSTEVVECVAADDCSEDDSVSGSEDVKVGEEDTCGDVGNDDSAGDMDGPVSVEYAEVEDGSASASASTDDVADDVVNDVADDVADDDANDVADGSAEGEDVKYDDNSEEVGDGASSDGSGSANVEVAATTGVDEVEPCLLPYFVLTEEGKSDVGGGNDGVRDGGGDGDGIDAVAVAEGRAVAVLVPVPVL